MSVLQRIALMVPAIRRLRDSRDTLLAERAGRPGGPANALSHYHACFDAEAILYRHALPAPQPRPGYLVNFLGVAIDPKFFPAILDGRAGQVEGVPIPANWHADIAEWAAALRAVELAREHRTGCFTMIELGCGWGCWLNNAGTAARNAGLAVQLIGIEGDRGHIAYAHEATAVNGFDADCVTLHHGIAAASAGSALFPRQEQAGVEWGLEPILHATRPQIEKALRRGGYDELPMVPLETLIGTNERIDLLHIDIQGGEADLIADCLPVLGEKIAYLLVGTHSRQIEGRIADLLLQAGWRLEVERPAILSLAGPRPVVTIDGVQGWRNPALLP